MVDDVFGRLRHELVDGGVSPRVVRRIVRELGDHLQDLRDEGRRQGLKGRACDRYALRAIGDQRAIVRQVLQDDSLRHWIYRYPRIAKLVLPVAYAAVLPLAPVQAGMSNAGLLARWGAALMLGAGVTASMLLVMQLAIVLT